MADQASPGTKIISLWNRLRPLPGGSWLFSRLLGIQVPYTGSMGAQVRELSPGYARVTLSDRRSVRNHLDSIHAVALTNLGEITTGLAMMTALPPSVRSIVINLSTSYLKKARGTLTAECRAVVGEVTEDRDQVVEAELRDSAGDVVSRTQVVWRLGIPK